LDKTLQIPQPERRDRVWGLHECFGSHTKRRAPSEKANDIRGNPVSPGNSRPSPIPLSCLPFQPAISAEGPSARPRPYTKEFLIHMQSLRKLAFLVLLGTLLPLAAAQAQWVRIAPPPRVIERQGPPPGRGYTWVPGYHRWDGHRYLWVGGRWVLPPRPRAVWVAGYWAHSPHGWFWRPGHWRR
jgi:hypothetical protein